MIRSLKLDWGILQYEFERKKIKNINLRIRADRTVYVSAPCTVPMRIIEAFIASKSDFIKAAVERIPPTCEPLFNDGDKIRLLGTDIPVRLSQSSKSRVYIRDNTFIIELKDPNDEKKRINIAQRFITDLAKEYLTEVLDEIFPLFEKYAIEHPSLYFRNAKTRWGSCCKQKGTVMLSTRLIQYPRCAVQYVAAHELAHLIVQNHSKAFYDVLESVMPDYKDRRRILKG